MALVLSGWDSPGRIADDNVRAWRSSRDAHADQDPGRGPAANAYAGSHFDAATQPDGNALFHLDGGGDCAQSQPAAQ